MINLYNMVQEKKIRRDFMSEKDEYYENKEYPSRKYIVEDGGDENIYFLKEDEKLELNDYEDVKAFLYQIL